MLTSVIEVDGDEYTFSNGVWTGTKLSVVSRLNFATEYVRIAVLSEGHHAEPHKTIVEHVIGLVPGARLVYHKGEEHVPGRVY